jgi:hypothetical protein
LSLSLICHSDRSENGSIAEREKEIKEKGESRVKKGIENVKKEEREWEKINEEKT